MFPPDGLLTTEPAKHDVDLNPHNITPDPFASDDRLNDFSPVHPFLMNTTEEELMMNPGTDELSSGLNGRLRPRRSNIPSPQSTKLVRKSEGKTGQDKAKRTNAASKTPPNKTDDLATKSDSTFLCPYCDKYFASKQTLSKHVRRMHGASSKQDSFFTCLFCSHYDAEDNEIIRHMAQTHSQQYFACQNCHTRLSSSDELAEHKSKACETKLPYRSRLRQKLSTGSMKETHKDGSGNESKVFPDGHSFNGVVISCELKPSQVSDGADIEDNITTNLILPPSKSLGSNTVIEKSAVIVLDDIQWNKRIPPNFSFHNTDADQILSRLGVVHRSPRTGEPTKKDWKNLDETTQKFEKCFDTSFYSKVASNVHENLSKFLDGSFNFNPDPDSTIKTRKSKNSVMINTAEGFPILLASEQYSRNAFDRYMPRAIAPKHKWKWDNLESEKDPINPDQIKRDSHTNNCIISLVSSLDIWTQLRMRHKFEEKFGCPPLEKKTEKQTIISNELKDILESRELPTPSTQVVKMTKKATENPGRGEFPACLGLLPSSSTYEQQPAVLSGEWVRPRCYVCCACGAQSRDSRAVSTHVTTQHPNAQVQHYEIVGEQLLNADILKHLYVPPSQMCNRTRPPRGFRECTKCRKSITLDDLHQHMLDCAGDTPAVRRKCRYRPFGVRRRRPRLPDNTIRKKIRKDIRTRQTRPKGLMRPRPIRTEVGDAETIRKMIADLPAKRHRVLVNPTNPALRPHIKQRPKILIKRRQSEDRNKRIKRNKEISETRPRPGSPVNDAVSVKSDEDNKPLKPKLRRVASKPPRRSEPDKRKTTVLTRTKRPTRQVKRVAKNDNIKGTTALDCNAPSKVNNENISIDSSSQRIEITKDFKAKEHAGQGQTNSNNHGGQRPRSGSHNGNSENHCAPAQNVPLKHSIARLTADSEKHDKSVQFHHLFLIQQECNNVNQHVQSGPQLLFENEAAVLTLDKPPLHHSNKGPLDGLQKSKLNKPRKGLNACIAMLKNKLVEPATESTIPAGHVSVQCGDDEPLYVKADTETPNTAAYGTNVEIVTNPEKTNESSLDINASPGIKTRQSSNQEAKSVEPKFEGTDQITPPSLCEIRTVTKKQHTVRKRESSRKKSMVNDSKTVDLPSESLQAAPGPLHAPQSVSPKVVSVSASATPQKSGRQLRNDRSTVTRRVKDTDSSKKMENSKPNEGQHLAQQIPVVKPYDTLNEPGETQITLELTKPNMSDHEKPENETKNTTTDQSNVYYRNCLNIQQQVDHSGSEYSCKVSADNFPPPDFDHVPVNNRPAHASTHVESIVAIPLDLSGKVVNLNTSQDLLNNTNTYLLGNSYDGYETLDLSNKSQDLKYREENLPTPDDEIVDLSIKSSNLRSTEAEILEKDDVTDLSLKTCFRVDIPTDLTVRKNVIDNAAKSLVDILDNPVIRELTLKKQMTNAETFAKPQPENKVQLPPAKPNTHEKQVTGISLTGENITATERIPTSKSNKILMTNEKFSENNSVDVPADLSYQQRSEEKAHSAKYASSKPETDARKVEENLSNIHARTCDKAFMQMQKPIYDPTLKIPQYKIRATSTIDNPSNIDLPACDLAKTTSSPTIPTVSETASNLAHGVSITTSERTTSLNVQDHLAFAYGSVSLNAPSSNTGSIYSITNCGTTSQLSKFESTTPVYTLAKACISVTKIESTNSATLTNTLLSIPGTTIANTTPVYTLAGTTIDVQGNYSHFASAVPSNSGIQKNDGSIVPGTSSQIQAQCEKDFELHKEKMNNTHVSHMLNVDEDPETARKIALLPKELVDVLGNMPVDHRNRLLNILPQYVSTPTSESGLKGEFSNRPESSSKLNTPREQKEYNVSGEAKNKTESELKVTSPLFNLQQEKHMLGLLNSSTQAKVENMTNITPPAPPTMLSLSPTNHSESSVITDDFTLRTQRLSKNESPTEALNITPDLISEDCIKASITNRPSLSLNVLPDKVIDLTEDEAVTRPEIHNPVVEMLPQISLLVQPKRNKANNDQTASLRAVRIKAPSARQRSIDSQLGKCTSMVPVLSNKINTIEQDNEVEKSLQCNVSLNTDISLAIQQAEVSSTQHSNKNVTTECKFPSVISPNLQESNSDETNNCASRLSSESTKEETIKIDEIHNVQSVVKRTLVTSSVVNNEINKDLPQVVTKEYSTLSSDLPDTKFIQNMKLDGSSEDSDSPKNNLVITESSILKTSDISKSYDLPIKCSTPKPAVLLGQETLPLKISPESHISDASEDVEDSDDDLSLAVICKQKQQNLLNKGPPKEVNKSTKEVDIEMKKKEKSNRNMDDILPISDSSLVNNNTVMPISLHKEEPKSTDMGNNAYVTDISEYNVKQKNRKQRRKNIAKNTKSNITTCEIPPKTDLDSVTINTEHNEVSVVGSVKENSLRNDLDNGHSISTARKRSKVNDDVLLTENITDFSSEKSTIDSKSKASIKQKSTKKKRMTTAQAESQNSQNLKEKKYESIDVNPSATEPGNTNEIGSNLKSETKINDSLAQGSSNMEIVSIQSYDVPLGPCSSLEEDRNTSTPLRRSKRVRSRNNSAAGEELQVEIYQENRTPLTKKQLIFSKLLLDEENNVKNPEGATDGNVENLKKNTESEVAVNKLTEAPVAIGNMQQKRKKTALLKRKCKKKKPLNSALSCQEDGLQGEAKHSAAISHGEQKPSGADERSDHSDMSVFRNFQPSETSLTVSIEKRKSGDLSSDVALSQSSQPKKAKLNTADNRSEILNIEDDDNAKVEKEKCNSDKNDTLQSTINIPKTTTGSKLNENDLRMTTCYNMPAASRRTRSKSAVIKTVVYDPYDIDMDDMIEHAEPLRQRKTSSDYRSTNNVKQITYLKDTKHVTSIDKPKKKEPSRELPSIERSLDFHSNHDGSDSDDSSKSDVPLKKYVEEKEKKISDLTESISTPKNDVENEVNGDLNLSSKNNTVLDRKNRRTLGVCNTGEGIAQDETEEQLRSEQFMESFGFFSERKPRKSNLLATKKISETFHIIANENDDIYGKHKDQNSKKERKTQNENRKSVESDSNLKGTKQRSPQTKKTVKRGRKKKNSTTVTAPSYCHICKKDFRRSDNFLRHQMTLLHVSKMSEVEMKIKTVTIQEEPNYLLAYKEHLDRLKVITDKMLKRKKNSKSTPKISPLSLEEILADVNKIVREQQHSHRGLSCDEELFLDCCELLKESHKKQDPVTDIPSLIKDSDDLCPSQATNVGLDLLGKTDIDVKSDNKNDGDVDSITAKTILESEEVRNLENDLISGLKEAANASSLNKSNIDYQQTVSDEDTCHLQDFGDNLSSPAATESQYEQLNTYDESVELKSKKYPEFKEKMYPDVEEFDMFEDKFDKIKRKCRSQAAAAKQPQLVVEPSISRKGRKKSDKKKIKKSSKKNHPNTVLTKGALKGFDGIKVSIPTSDIDISAIVSPLECSHKKKKKGTTRKKRENKNSESSSKYDSDHPLNDSSTSLKNVDVYEFMDNEDVELFEFRPSTLMERFKSITNKETPSTFKVSPVVEEPENSSASASDGDDFVYMSDDYVCSDDETENSLMSCDVSNTKLPADTKKLSSQIKKRDAVEKNAVMGKIFKNNAVRSEKKLTKTKEPAKPKANLDQLFDSLLEDEPSSSMLNDESLPLRDDETYTSKFESQIVCPSRSEEPLSKYEQNQIKKKNNVTTEKESYTLKYKNMSSDNDDDEEPSSFIDYGPSTSKLSLKSFMGDHKSTKPGMRPSLSPPELKPVSPKKCDTSQKHHSLLKKQERISFVPDDYLEDTGILRKRNDGPKKDDSKSHDEMSPARKIDDDFGVSNDHNDIGDQTFTSDETGVARQRARRKCTVGKQNILAETWSSESEPDGGPPRPNSAESMASGSTRKKKGKKKDGQHSSGRRTNNRHISIKKQEIASRVSSSIRNNAVHTTSTNSGAAVSKSPGSTLGTLASDRSEPSSSAASTSGATSMCVEEPTGGPSTSSCASTISSPSAGPCTSTEGAAAESAEPTFLVPAEPGTSGGPGRPRTLYYWSSDGSDSEQVREALAREQRERDEAQQQQQQQHGWIVGDSHKKLVTMLAHAKGRKRNNDDKRHKTE